MCEFDIASTYKAMPPKFVERHAPSAQPHPSRMGGDPNWKREVLNSIAEQEATDREARLYEFLDDEKKNLMDEDEGLIPAFKKLEDTTYRLSKAIVKAEKRMSVNSQVLKNIIDGKGSKGKAKDQIELLGRKAREDIGRGEESSESEDSTEDQTNSKESNPAASRSRERPRQLSGGLNIKVGKIGQ